MNPCSWIRRPTIVKELTKQIYRSTTSPTKISADPVAEIDKLISKLIWKCKRPRMAKTALKKESKVGKATEFRNF